MYPNSRDFGLKVGTLYRYFNAKVSIIWVHGPLRFRERYIASGTPSLNSAVFLESSFWFNLAVGLASNKRGSAHDRRI